MNEKNGYFTNNLPIKKEVWDRLKLWQISGYRGRYFYLLFHERLKKGFKLSEEITPSFLHIYSTLNFILRFIIKTFLESTLKVYTDNLINQKYFTEALKRFVYFYPPQNYSEGFSYERFFRENLSSHTKKSILYDLILLKISAENPAIFDFREIAIDDRLFEQRDFRFFIDYLEKDLFSQRSGLFGDNLFNILREPIKKAPRSLYEQLVYIKERWRFIIPEEILLELERVFDIIKEYDTRRAPGKASIAELSFNPEDHLYEPERFTPDTDWMPKVVIIAKLAFVWLHQLSKKYNKVIKRLDEIPDEELELLKNWGFNAIWLIGIWERSPASRKIKHIMGNIDAHSSAYSLYDYVVSEELGGDEAFFNLKERAFQKGIRLGSDMVPNHTGIFSKWTQEHPDWFIQLFHSPFPKYTFTKYNLSFSDHVEIYIEDGYYDRSDAAVVFKYVDKRDGKIRYIYHGNDGTSTPWNDTAQLNYLLPEVREAVIQTILHVARKTPIIRFDAAMTLTKRHYQRLWFPFPGQGGSIPSRAEHGMSKADFDKAMPEEFWREVVNRVAKEAPDTLLLAEAFWLLEGYFVRSLGMHRVYNSAFMNMLKAEENGKYRQIVKNILHFNPEILKRFVNFMSNPDEQTAIEQFGEGGKYLGVCVLLSTMPGLPMFAHGQIEGFKEKYGMEYHRPCWDEQPNQYLIEQHKRFIFPLLKKRYLFSEAKDFYFFDFITSHGVDEDVFAYTNAAGDEKTVLVYNNRYKATSGYINYSCEKMVKNPDGSQSHIKKSIFDAMRLKKEDDIFYLFRDHRTNLNLLVNPEDLLKEGLYFELGAYEFHLLLDMKELRDDEDKNISKIYERYKNKFFEDFEELYLKTRYEKLLNAFEIIYHNRLEDKEGLIQKISDFYMLLGKKRDFQISEEFLEDIYSHISIPEIETSGLLNLTILDKILKYQQIELFDSLKSLKLDRLIEKQEALGLSYLVLKKLKEMHISKDLLTQLFEDDHIKKFLNINFYQQVLYFNKERFEELVTCFFILDESRFLSIKDIDGLFELAKEANYSVEKFLTSLSSEERKEAES